MSERLKREFLELLERDVEFRYAVAGYLGLSEILKRLDRHWEAVERLLEEIKALRESQEKLWEEVRALREDQRKLWENQEKLWREVEGLKAGQSELSRRLDSMEDYTRSGFESLQKALRRLEDYTRSGFASLRKVLRYTFEDFASAFVEVLLEDMGYPGAEVRRGYLLRGGRVLEVDVLCEDPLVVGEATLSVGTREEAEAEVAKLLERVEAARETYGREPLLKILCVARAEPAAAEALRELASKQGVKLVVGEELEGWQ